MNSDKPNIHFYFSSCNNLLILSDKDTLLV